jgi:hypothetical protein
MVFKIDLQEKLIMKIDFKNIENRLRYRKTAYLVPGTTIVLKKIFEGSTRYQMQLKIFSNETFF